MTGPTVDVPRLAELEAWATRAPWWHLPYSSTVRVGEGNAVAVTHYGGEEQKQADAELIVALRNAAPQLLTAYQQLQAVIAVVDNINVPPAEIRAGYEMALRAVRRAIADPEAVLNPPEHGPQVAAAGVSAEEARDA